MGLCYDYIGMFAKAKFHQGISFDNVLTIGHLSLYLSLKEINKLSRCYGIEMEGSKYLGHPYADEFLQEFLGTKKVSSLDCSDYQGGNIIHDLNYPIDSKYHEEFDVVVDGGSIEHIFNLPAALSNYMNMVKKGGSLFILTMANNHQGHGFYQLSPEFFFRAFQPTNGFTIQDVILIEHSFPGIELSPKTRCFSVTDPAQLKKRVGLVSRYPTAIMAHAIRTEIKPVFAQFPIQSDYAAMHQGVTSLEDKQLKAFLKKCLKFLPRRWRNFLRGKRQLLVNSLSNRSFYKKWFPNK